MFRKYLTEIAKSIEVKPLQAGRPKSEGFMAESGSYTIGDFVLDDYGHYFKLDEPRHWSLKSYRGKDAYWHLGLDAEGKVWFSPSGFFSGNIPDDWEPTDLVID